MQRVSFATPPWLVALLVATALVFGLFARGESAAGRVLLGAAVVALCAEAVRAAVLRPVLVADADGIELLRGLRRRRYPWAAVELVQPSEPLRRGGRRRQRGGSWLEIELAGELVTISAYRLGVSAAEAATALDAARSSAV